jgi:hypothetical protein
MELDVDKLFENAMRDAIRDGIKAKFSGYNSPLDKLCERAMEANKDSFRSMMEEAIGSCVTDSGFRSEIAAATRTALAKTLVQRFGGEIEKQVNALKSDPTTRARIVIAIEEIVKSQPH